jgi:hypothetical protein
VTTFSWAKEDTRWYLGVQCQKCKVPILFALDHTGMGGDNAPPSAGRLVLTCSTGTCRHRADYTTARVSRFQKPSPDVKEIKNEGGKKRKH